MSSTSRSQDEKAAAPEEPEKKNAGSPGRYSLADDGSAVPSTRIDSTSRMPAVRLEGASPKSSGTLPAQGAPASVKEPPASASPTSNSVTNKKPPVPSVGGPPKPNATQRAMPAPQAKGAAPASPPSQRAPNPPESKGVAGARAPDVRPPAKSVDLTTDEKKPVDAKVASPKPPPVKPPPPSAKAPQRTAAKPPSAPPPSAPVGSVRPQKVPTEPPLDGLTLEELDEGSIAFAFDALISEDRASQPGTHEFDLAPVRELFAALAANHMRHVRDFMIDVKWGEVTRDWIHICVPPVRTLRRAADRLDLVELGVALEKLGTELDAANAVGGQMLDANEKQRLLDTYEALVTILPQAFALDRDKTQREGVIVQALLLQVPDVRKVTIDKLTAAGLTSLTELFEANADDIAHVAGIPLALATRIVERVQAYRAEIQSSSPQDARAAEREKLAGLNGQLKRVHDAYEEAANGWGPEAKAKKRDHFRAREETWLEISVLLARFGEVDRLAGIEKVPFARRIAQLSDYLEEAREKYRAGET